MYPAKVPRAVVRGYTLIELLSTMAILVIVTAVAVPSFRDFVQNGRAAADTNALVTALHLARNEAITRGLPVSVCSSDDQITCKADMDWSIGWIVFTDANAPTGTVDAGANPDTVLRVFPAVSAGAAMAADTTAVTYRANGFLANGAPVNFSLTVPDCTGDRNRDISVNLQGRAGLAHVACP